MVLLCFTSSKFFFCLSFISTVIILLYCLPFLPLPQSELMTASSAVPTSLLGGNPVVVTSPSLLSALTQARSSMTHSFLLKSTLFTDSFCLFNSPLSQHFSTGHGWRYGEENAGAVYRAKGQSCGCAAGSRPAPAAAMALGPAGTTGKTRGQAFECPAPHRMLQIHRPFCMQEFTTLIGHTVPPEGEVFPKRGRVFVDGPRETSLAAHFFQFSVITYI